MPTVANYPDGVGTAGPTIDKVIKHPIEYKVERFLFDDGGCDVNLNPCGILRWTLKYDGLTASDVATLRTHLNLAKGGVSDFSFYDRHDSATYTKCRYRSWKVGKHQKTWFNTLTVEIENFA
jgi:hypothetical protein